MDVLHVFQINQTWTYTSTGVPNFVSLESTASLIVEVTVVPNKTYCTTTSYVASKMTISIWPNKHCEK